MRPPLRDRLYSRLTLDPETGCLLWGGHRDDRGYGRISINGLMRKVHRVAWELEMGPIPPGLMIDHVKARGCRHRNCANVAHLEPVTMRENNRRGDTLTAANAVKTHCIQGHPFDQANTYIWRGWRHCRACKREWCRARTAAEAA